MFTQNVRAPKGWLTLCSSFLYTLMKRTTGRLLETLTEPQRANYYVQSVASDVTVHANIFETESNLPLPCSSELQFFCAAPPCRKNFLDRSYRVVVVIRYHPIIIWSSQKPGLRVWANSEFQSLFGTFLGFLESEFFFFFWVRCRGLWKYLWTWFLLGWSFR